MLQLVFRGEGRVYQVGEEMKEILGTWNRKSKGNEVGENTVRVEAAGTLVMPCQGTGRIGG